MFNLQLFFSYHPESTDVSLISGNALAAEELMYSVPQRVQTLYLGGCGYLSSAGLTTSSSSAVMDLKYA